MAKKIKQTQKKLLCEKPTIQFIKICNTSLCFFSALFFRSSSSDGRFVYAAAVDAAPSRPPAPCLRHSSRLVLVTVPGPCPSLPPSSASARVNIFFICLAGFRVRLSRHRIPLVSKSGFFNLYLLRLPLHLDSGRWICFHKKTSKYTEKST